MSRAFRLASLLALLLLVSAANESAFARNGSRGGHSGGRHVGGHRAAVGVILAAPVFWHFRSPIYAPVLAPVVVPMAPPVYIERGSVQPETAQSAGDWWYYCEQTKGYYPYVKECAQGWQRVAPEPSAGR